MKEKMYLMRARTGWTDAHTFEDPRCWDESLVDVVQHLVKVEPAQDVKEEEQPMLNCAAEEIEDDSSELLNLTFNTKKLVEAEVLTSLGETSFSAREFSEPNKSTSTSKFDTPPGHGSVDFETFVNGRSKINVLTDNGGTSREARNTSPYSQNHVAASHTYDTNGAESVKSQEKAVCQVCERSFKSFRDLGCHLQIHRRANLKLGTGQVNMSAIGTSQVKPLCGVCGEDVESFNVVLHKMKHEKDNIECSLCNLRFQCGLQCTTCPVCRKRYACPRFLKMHLKTHEKQSHCLDYHKRSDHSNKLYFLSNMRSRIWFEE